MSGRGISYVKQPPFGEFSGWVERELEMLEKGVEDAAYGLRWDDLRFAAGAIRVDPAGLVASPAIDNVETDVPGTLLFSGTVDNLIADVANFRIAGNLVQLSDLTFIGPRQPHQQT